MEQGKPNKTIGKKTRFSKENQPSNAAKAAGMRKFWEYKNARKALYEAMLNLEMPDGKKRNFWELICKKLQSEIFDKTSKLTEREKVDLIMKLIKELTPEDKNVNLETDQVIKIIIGKVDEGV